MKKQKHKSHSYSRICSFEVCKHRYNLMHNLKVPHERAEILKSGEAVHEAVKSYVYACIEAGQPQLFDRHEEITAGVLENMNLPHDIEEEVFAMVKNYAEQREVILDGIYGPEQKFALDSNLEQCDWLDKDVFYRFKIDLLYIKGDHAKIIDFKSGYKIISDKFQLQSYAWGLKKIFPQLNIIELEFDYIRHDLQHSTVIFGKDIDDVGKKILRKCRQIEREKDFKPEINYYCEYCEFIRSCPLINKLKMEYKAPRTLKEAKELAKEYIGLDLKKSEMTRLLSNFLDSHKPFQVSGRKFYISAFKVYNRVDIAQIIADCEKQGINYLPLLQLDTKEAKKRAKDDPDLEMVLQANSSPGARSSMRIKKMTLEEFEKNEKDK